jgi:hypothetical protein
MNWLQDDILYKENCNRGNTFVNCRTLHHYFRNILRRGCMAVRFTITMHLVPTTTEAVSSNPTQSRCTRYNIMWYSLPVTCDRSVVFSVSFTNNTDRREITEILLSGVKHQDYQGKFFGVGYWYAILILSCCRLSVNL